MVFGSSRNSSQAICEINTTPLVDVLLVLTIFFMFVAPLMTNQIDAAASFRGGCFGPTKSPVVRIVDIFATPGEKPSIALDGFSLGVEQLAVEMKAEALKGPKAMAEVYIRTAPDAAFPHMAKVLALINASGIELVHLDGVAAPRSLPLPTNARFRLVSN